MSTATSTGLPTYPGIPAFDQANVHPPIGLACWTLWKRELVRFFRQRNRIIGAIATPLLFWLLLGCGLDRAMSLSLDALPHPPASATAVSSPRTIGYLEYFYPGSVLLVLLFTAIFSTITVIEDRREGFLQAVLVAPVSRLEIVLGKVLGGATIAAIQAVLFLALWPLVHGWPGTMPMIAALMVAFILALCLTSLSLCLAWPMDSTAGFHAVMNLLLMPMWFLSGAVFPVGSSHPAMQWLMWINPLTYGQAAFTAALYGQTRGVSAHVPWPVSVAMLLVFTAVAIAASVYVVSRPRKDGQA